ncbi:MAG: DUF6491 family protein [Gammaproteobacteria bacterium]|nr:DUF6491 family protein [Gammaproteobacteria bacterium]
MSKWVNGALLLTAALAGGCASVEATQEERQAREAAKKESIQDILSQPLANEDYSEEERCLSTYSYRSVDVLDDQHVLFKGTGGRLWLNTLRQRCVGLRAQDTLSFELRDNRLCDMDRFESVDTFAYMTRTSATCTLGKFSPVTAEQVQAIEAAVKESRQRN